MSDALIEQVVAALAKVKHIDPETITAERTLESLRLDSLDTITLLFELEDAVGVSIPDERIKNLRTVGDVIGTIRQLKDPAIAGT